MCVQECSFIQRVRYAILWWLAPYLSWLVSLHSRRTGIVRTVTSHSLSHSLSLCIYTTSFAALLSCNHHHHISTPNSPRNVLLPPPLSSENVYRLAPDERCINNPPWFIPIAECRLLFLYLTQESCKCWIEIWEGKILSLKIKNIYLYTS